MAEDKTPFQRLPSSVLPNHYDVSLKPDLKSFTFQGEEKIFLQVKDATKIVVMNSADITVSSAQFFGNGKEITNGIEIATSQTDETLTLTFPEELPRGDGKLSLVFSGQLNDKMKGFYRSKYFGPSGDERFAAVTQFEATDARRAFPCWDEPAIKATFDITLTVPEDRVAISNMPEKSCTPLAEYPTHKVVKFERSPIMSTYLVAFVVGEFDFVESVDEDGVKVRVYTGVGKREQGDFALKVAVKTLPFYKKYFNIAYPLPKIDLIAISDFAAGAMENWGLVTYRETALLIDPQNSSSASRQWVALVVGHELAHQWFGNLVTMEWWTHLWLNEGFATWIEYLCVDHCFPEFDIWTQFASSDFTRALELDALRNSHPIEVPVGHPDEIDEIFDAISYSKGASVIRMLHDFIGDEDFGKGMHAYLTKHKYKNTFTEDLWEALGEASGKPVQKIMTTWTKQMGFPVLKVDETKEGSKRTLKVSQEKFCADGAVCDKNSTWMVPISVSSRSSPTEAIHRCVLEGPETTIVLENVPEGDWVKLNTGAVGFYRTRYSSTMLEALMPAVSDGSLPPRDRLGLQNDLFALARAGVSSTVDFLKLAQAFKEETNYTVWSDLQSNLLAVKPLMQYGDVADQYNTYLRNLFSTIFQKRGWDATENESPLDALLDVFYNAKGPLDAMLRGLVIGMLGSAGDSAVVAEARSRFSAHAHGSSQLPADLRGPVYRTILRHGGENEYEELLKLLRAADLHEEKVRIMRSLGASASPDILKKTLEFSLSDEVRSQDTVFVIGSVTGSLTGRDMAWRFLRDQWSVLHDRYEGGFLLSRLIKNCTDNFASTEKADEVEAFFKEHKASAAARTIQQSLENIRLNGAQLDRDRAALQAFLQ